MNMKKKIGICATLLAALLCAVPQSVQAIGKIRSVDVYDADGNRTFPNANAPLTVGDTIYVRFRLANLMWAETTANPSFTNPWYFAYTGTLTGNETLDELTRIASQKPRLGLWISGRVREAECINFPGVLTDWLADELDQEKHYTELTFKYTIQAGDFALPVQIANASGTGPATGEEPYYLKYEGQPIHWELQSTNTTGTVTSEFAFGPADLHDDTDFTGDLSKWDTVSGRHREIRDLDLLKAGVYVQAIDFDKTYSDPTADIWRTIAQESTTANPGVPTVVIEGGAATPMTLYVWAESNTVAEVALGGQVVELADYDFGGGVTRKVGTLRINAGDTSVPFYVKATGSVGATTKVFLSATPTNIYNQSNNLITNFITRTVEVGQPLPPSIDVTVDGAASREVTAPTNHTLSLVAVNVRLSKEYTEDFDVPIKVTLKNNTLGLDPTNYVGLSTRDANNNMDWTTTLRVRRNQNTATASLWMYANRGSVDTKSGLIFSVDTNSTTWASSSARTFFSEFNDAIVYIKPSNPVILTDMTKTYDAVSGVSKTFEIDVLDSYGERDGPYTIKWAYDFPPSSDADYTPIAAKSAIRSGDFESTIKFEVPVSMTKRVGTYTNYFYLVNQDGGRSSGDTMVVWRVKNPLSSGVHVTRLQEAFAEDGYDYQDAVKISFDDGFSMPDKYLQPEGYIFLVPLSEDSRDLVYCEDFDFDRLGDDTCDWRRGLKIDNATEEIVIPMTFLDGGSDAASRTRRYQVFIQTADELNVGQFVTEWGTNHTFEVFVTNVAPAVSSVSVGGRKVFDGENIGAFSMDVEKAFYAETDEPSDVDYFWDEANGYADQTKSFTTKWEFFRDNESNPAFTTNVFGPPDQPFNYKLDVAGEYTVKVTMHDKDMVDRRGKATWGTEFSFSFTVEEKPTIILTPKYGTYYFSEDSPGDLSQIDVSLTLWPKERISVQLTIERDGPNTGDYPLPTLSTTTLTFGGGNQSQATSKPLTLRDLDGTEMTYNYGFVIRAAVTNANFNSDNVRWRDVYLPNELLIKVENKKPEIERLEAVVTNSATVYTKVFIPLDFKDFSLRDMQAGESVWWKTSDGFQDMYTVSTNAMSYHSTYELSFSKPGLKTVTLRVKDKDSTEWSDPVNWYYLVSPARQLFVTPCGPGSRAADVAENWLGNAGFGRVWLEDDRGDPKPFSINRFRHLYTYDRTTASVGAFGYKATDTDNGALTPSPDWAITQAGAATTTGPHYNNSLRATDGKDSFIYMWLQSRKGENGLETTRMALNPYNPQTGMPGGFVADLPTELQGDDKETATYPDTYVDAIFSKEYLVTDNIGDINQDHIPDLYAVTKVWRGSSLFETVGGSTEDGMVQGDLFDFYNYNGDGDYLPSDSFEGGLPSTANGWSTLSVPFDAELEVRGFHEGLNHRTDSDGLNLFVRGRWASDPCFSEAETNAVAHWNGVQTWAEFKETVPTDDPDYATKLADWQAAFRTALDKNDSWIPEKRTNPTLWDTDNDSLPDGYEYYFWYRAAVGEMKNGKWVQTTGEKFTLNNITKGEPLSAEDIMKAFDPTVKAAGDIAKRDTDNDGLTDIEEFAMGTNPVHWDSDGDGMSDLWEVMRGMNPLKVPTQPEMNVDGDFMAAYHTPGSYAIVTLNNGKVYALEQNGTNLKTFEADSFDGDGGKTKGGTNVLASVVFGVEDVSNVTALAVFHYGNDSSACVPKKRGNPNAQVKPLDPDEVSLADTEVVSVQLRQSLMLIHDQVYNQHEFHPYTAWHINANGDVSARWGAAVNTVPYNCVDEYRLMKYRYETGIATPDNGRPLADLFLELTTNPNTPFTDAGYTVSWTGTDGGGSEQVASIASIPTYTSGNHGADTDEDGIPDGWELYVGANPNDATDAAGDGDRDGLSLRNEYAGSDSCNAYENAVNAEGTATIYQYHPGNAKGWFNKFTPTDPKDSDTDRDGVSDGAEGNAFIFGDPTDDGSKCIRGGGLNPCGVDTDFDLLPDGWERQYQGTVVPAGTGFEGIHPDIVQIIKRNDNLGSNAVIRAYISYGMDGTYNDAFKVPTANQVDPRTGTRRNLDFDNDGLHNFQEYLVQVLRHLRYDDTETPLMGSYLPNGIAGTRKYIGFLPMQVWDGSTFFKTARAAGFTGLSARQGDGFKFRELGYFAPPEKTWDLTMSGNRILMPPRGLSDIATADDESRMSASRYVGTDPRNWDTDDDGMDDYYELFHGLNPLLGGKDVISEAYSRILSNKKLFSARCTAWSNWEEKELVYDAMRFPWAMGVAEADADGDGLRNTDEALLVNMPNPVNYHTDPTPLWMTDSSSKISVTAQYYCRDPYASGEGEDIPALSSYFWFTYIDGRDPGSVNKFMFTFEENEGYDTDHDWIPDEQELTHAVTGATSPQHGSDPDRRQAMYFPGEESVVQSYSGNLHRRIGENYAMLRSFSVEAWVRPEDLSREQTIVTRVCNYPSSTLSNATHQVRANFRIKMEAGGRIWGQFDSDDAVPNGSPKGFGTTSVEGDTLESNKWSHVALTFDGNALILYVNGREINRSYSNLIPANGLIVTLQEVNPNGSNYGVDGYDTYPSALLIGADAKELGALDIGPDSSWTNYCAHYKGWVDEVRVWDGARTQEQIATDFTKRYTLQDVSDMRSEVYKKWLNSGTHNPNDGRPNLPTELVFHYGFQQLPSEIVADYVTSEPSGFTERVLDNVKWNGRSVDIRCGWWNAVPIASTVYGNRAIVPWVRDTCAMLPALDGSSYDSRYWSELIGGITFPTEVNVQKFLFPNVANPYPYWNYMAETFFREQRLDWMRGSVGAGLSDAANDVYNRLRFGNRTLFVGGSDLLPLGGAFAKRCPDFWDGHGSTDAWTATVDDTDNDGLPDWWEAHAAAEYGADAATLTTKTKVNYKLPSGAVVEMSAWEAYQIDLARGIMPGLPATYDPAYESLADNNNDGLPDWWQKLYDIYDLDPDDDPDNDGLSIYQEWLISWGDDFGFGVLNGYPFLSPTKARSGDAQEVTDYFLKSTTAPYEGYYMGEIVADFDMMEDGFEDAFGTDDTAFDAWSDYDEDGWSAWSELRYSTYKMSKAGQFVSHNVGDTEVVDSPEPVIHATLRYNGEIPASSTNTTFIVQAYSGNNMLKAPTATYVVKPGTAETRTYYLGMQEDRIIHGTFTPGFVQAQKGAIELQYAYVQPSDSYSWRVTVNDGVQEYSGTYEELSEAITRYGANLQVASLGFNWTPVNGTVSATDGTSATLTMDVNDATQKGYLLLDMERVGEIDFTTGDFTFDLSKLAGKFFTGSSIASENCFYRIRYNVKLPTMQNKKLSLSLGKPTSGALVEGSTAFEAFIDLDGNGAFTPDVEPYGFVKNVDVGWDNVPELVIEMTDASAAAGKRFAYPAGDTNVVRIIRTAINGKEVLDNGEPVRHRIVYNRDVTISDRTSVHEGDLVTAGKFGLDWANLRSDVEAMNGLDPKSVLSVTYTVVKGEGSVMNIDPTNVVEVFTVSFPAEQSKPSAVAPSPLTGPKVETQRPTFKWTGTEDNTAFILQILDTDENPVYTSPLQVLPPRDSSGAYVWTAPVYVGTNVCADAWSLDNNTNYSWRVAMFSPKFSNTNLATAVWSDATAFETRLAEGGTRTSAYGAADVQVRYFGPDTNDLSSVVVQLYKTADFTGDPAAQSRLFDVDGKVELLTNNTYSVRFLGLEEGTYYALAYIDRNGDCVRQRSESWGYANQIGTGVEELYTPVAVRIVSKSGSVPSVELFMEDTDVNQNGVPDCLDDEAILAYAASAAAGADTTDVDGDGLKADTETGETYTSASLWDTDGDGMPDGWEALFAGTDPLTADADTVIDGDVMAYAEETWKLVTDAAGNSYLVNPTNATVRVGDDLPLACLVSTYDYAGKYGVGTNLTDTATSFRVAKIENVTAVRVHAQVYDKYGYDPLTAVPVDDAVNTKPFTALDKYLLVRYFEALGFCTEADVNANGKWADFSLMPNDADNDRDGVLDGWELYTMFGTDGVTDTLADAKISPFNYDDARNTAPATGSALTVLEEFDGGNSPTDPWQTTTEGFTGLPDEIAYKFRIKSDADLLADPDNDGLSNWAEYLASVLTGEDFDVTDPCSVTPNRLDYFYQFQNPNDPDGKVKYIGESIDTDYFGLIADHDFMEDFVEDTLGYNRYVYDANIDYDGNGWDNWSEVRARYNEATWVVVDKVTNTYTRTFNSFTPEAKLQWRMWYDSEFKPKVSPLSSGLLNTLPSAWIFSVKYYDVNGEERTVISPNGQPVDNSSCEITWYEFEDKKAYGGHVAPNVNFTIYGIDAGETNVTIAAYTDKNLLTPDATLDRNGKVLSGSLKQGLNTFIVTSGAKTGFAKANVGFDRVDVEIALRADAIAFNVEPQTNTTTRVRVQRTAINGTSFAKPRTVYAKTIDLRNGKTFTEADLLKDGEYDFDQTYLVTDAEAAGVAAADIRSVSYAVYLDWGSAEPIYTFTRTFPAKLVAPAPSGATGHHGNVVEAARPTLVWQAPEGASAFMLEVAKDEAFSEIIYATTNFMPVATAEGCQFKPDLYVGAELEDGTNYFWRVASVDAVTNSVWSTNATFRTAVNVNNADTGYGRIAAEVRYFGPSSAVLSDVVVGVYESADFKSEPVARKRLVGGDSVSTLTNDLTKAFDVVSTNIVLDGIAPGTYYLMAFIDTNTNNVRDAWESWGYVNKIGTEAVDLYTPAALKVKSTKAMPPTAFLVMEDTDVNQNWTPDCLEETALDGWIPASQIEPEEPVAANTDTDGDGLSDAEEDDYGTDPKNPDTDGDGLPDGFEIQAGSDPLFADSDLAGANDVMAYKADTLKVMFTTNDVGEVTGRYVVNSRFEDGYAEQSNTVYTVFEVGGQLFVGAPTNRADVTSAYAYAFMTNVVVMHSAVYDFYGYDPTTAKPVAAAAATVATDSTDSTNETATATSAFGVNTVPFTAYLKYVTQKHYLAEFGDATNDFALAVNKLDSNANYLPDGYELYVRYAMWHDADNAYGDADARASYGDNIAQLPFDPYDDYYFYNYLKKQNPGLAATLPPFDNATAFDLGAVGAGGFAGASEDWWNWAPEDDYMAYVQTNVLVTTVTNAEGVASIYAIDPGTNTLYETFYVGNELFVGAVCTNEYAYDAMENGEFMTMVTNATVIHSAVYDWYGFDPTTAKPSYFWPESIAYLAESNSNYTVGANSAPFTRRMKLITQMMYLPQVGAEDDYNLTTWWTDTNGNDMPDGWELYVKYTASSDPNKPDDDYKGDFDDGSDPNADDTDGDGIPDDVEQFFGVTDPLVKDADTVLENDVMAFANVNATVVTVQNTAEGSLPVKYLLAEEMAGNTVAAPKVGDDAASLALRATYEYLVTRADGLATNVCGVSTNVMLTAADGTTNRVVAVGVEPVVLVHAQVYDYFGFNPNTANTTAYAAGNAENTKLFTALDKYLVVRYLEAYDLAVATNDWKTLSLDPATSDGDADGVPDGWELYVMFGTEGITETIDAAKISPFNFDDARALAPAGDVTVIEKWNNGAPAYNPWSKDTNGNGIPDADEIKNGLSDLYGDSDNDQLPNFTEYLIGKGFANEAGFAGVAGISATNSHSLASLVTDYFRRIGNLYLGEMFTDHDFMEDFWEDQFGASNLSRAYYDPWNDPDDDGWSNYAECRAGTNPEIPANTYGLQGMSTHNYPIPTIHAKVVMGPGEGTLDGQIVVQAYSETSKTTGLPDAVWTVTAGGETEADSSSGSQTNSASANAKSAYLGINPGREISFTMAPGFITPGSVSIDVLDPKWVQYVAGTPIYGNLANAEWQRTILEDRPDPIDATKGDIVTRAFDEENTVVGTIDYTTGRATIDFTEVTNDWYIVDSTDVDVTATNASYTLIHLLDSHVRASWGSNVPGDNSWMTLNLKESDDAHAEQKVNLGHVREGNNTFVVFLDADGSGAWNPGEPYGVAKGVDVGWSDAEFTVELTRTTPIMARFDLVKAINNGSGDTGSGSTSSTGNGSTSKLTDRDAVNAPMGYAPNEESMYPGTNMPSNVSLTRVRVVRNWINRESTSADVLLDRYFDLSTHPFLTEADLLAEGMLDLDWGTLNRAFNNLATASAGLSNVTYRVVIGDGDVGTYANYGNNLSRMFSNLFEASTVQTPTVPDPKLAQMVYSGRPTFRWSHPNSINKAYPAFRLRIYASDGSTVVYDSGPQRAPARDSKGMYEWTAPVYAGMVTPSGHVLETAKNYYWAVSMLDAKFTAFSPNETTTPFRLSTSGILYDGKGYGSIAVRVKYFGPLVGSLSAEATTTKNLVRVQAFTSPDFSGTPVAEAYVTDVSTIASESVIATNAVLTGVAQGGTYYVRAYIDTDADGAKSDWESWGYACYVGDQSVKSVWTPKPVKVTYDSMMPDATVFIEDADTDGDDFPDAWEWNKNGNLTAQDPITGDTFFAAVNPDLVPILGAYNNVAAALGGGSAGTLKGLRLGAAFSTPIGRLMSASPMAAAGLLTSDGAEPPEETTAVRIKSFSLEDGLELEVVNTASVGDASGLIVFAKEATVQLSLACATTPDFADAVEVPVKAITIKANDTTDDGVGVTAEELAEARANVPEARFFKAILTK